MLAHRDQENLVHGHQTTAASKALNQGNKQLNPKTPGHKAPKTPFKVPLNDENDANAFASGKPGLKTAGKANGTVMKKGILGDKNNFVTPMGPKARAPLGQKTTNAKAKVLQTPGLAPDNDLGKSKKKATSVHKPKPRVSHAEPSKIDVLADAQLEERDIEYMPPPPKDLPDVPSDDEFHTLDLAMFKDGRVSRNIMEHVLNRPDGDGLSYNERDAISQKVYYDKLDAIHDARVNRDMDLAETIFCMHSPECSGVECKDQSERNRRIELEFQKKVAAIEKEYEVKTKSKWRPLTDGPSANASKKAASTLSMPKPTTVKPTVPVPKPARFPASIVSGKKPVTPMNPDARRHASAVRASNTTLNYSKGRATSATLRKTVLPQKEVTTSKKPAVQQALSLKDETQRYNQPAIGSENLARFRSYGCFQDEEPEKLEDDWSKQLEEIILDGANDDFQLTL